MFLLLQFTVHLISSHCLLPLVLDFLLAKGAWVEEGETKSGRTVLHITAAQGQVSIIAVEEQPIPTFLDNMISCIY